MRKINLKLIFILLYLAAQLSVISWYIAHRDQEVAKVETSASQKVYAAVEEDGQIAVLNPKK